LRGRGIAVIYVEGNRDYFLSPLFLQTAFDEIAPEATQAIIGGQRVYVAHGDLVNAQDRQYRLWRRISRSRGVAGALRHLPCGVALPAVNALERAMRQSNRKHKAAFPAALCQTFADRVFASGYDMVMLGHFHTAYRYESSLAERPKTLFVLPAWKDSHAYLCLNSNGAGEFRSF